MGEEYEPLGPAGAAPPEPPPVQFSSPQPPSPFPSSPGQLEAFQFPSATPTSSLTPSEQKDKTKKDEVDDKTMKETKDNEDVEQSISNIGCLAATLVLFIMSFIGIALVIFLIVLLYTKCFGQPECQWLKVLKFF